MRLSQISLLLDGRLSPAEFRASNASSFTEYRALSEKRGTAVPIRVEEDADLLITPRHIVAACEVRMAGDLRSEELAYLADVLQLSDRVTFLNEDMAEYIAEFTDPEINGPFTPARAVYSPTMRIRARTAVHSERRVSLRPGAAKSFSLAMVGVTSVL